MKNLSEREILQRAAESHLGQGIKRLTFRRLKCLQSFHRNGELIYEKGKTYKLWIVRYVDYILEITKDFTAIPHEEREDVVKKVCHIPENIKIHSLMIAGYPEKPAQEAQRFHQEYIHQNEWKD